MATNRETRRRNLLKLLEQAASQAGFARELEVEPAYISQLVTGERNIGDRTARKIERLRGLPEGWMDQTHEGSAAETPPQAVKQSVTVTRVMDGHLMNAAVNTISIPLLEIEASMGITGRVQPEYETILGHIELNEHFVRTHLPSASSPRNIRVITGLGDSMWSAERQEGYQDGDPLFVDVGIVDVRYDAVYVFAYRGDLYIKRLQRLPDGTLNVISDNKKYQPFVITDMAAVRIIARVCGAWNFRKL